MIKAIPRVVPKYESDNKFVWSVMSAIYQEKIDRCIFPISETKVRAREKKFLWRVDVSYLSGEGNYQLFQFPNKVYDFV